MLDSLHTITNELPGPVLHKTYFFHDVLVTCYTNHASILVLLESMLGSFPRPGKLRGEASYYVLCSESASHFPVQLPHDRISTGTVRLLTNTKLKYYRSRDYTTEYQSFAALPPINEAALSVISPAENAALTQIMLPDEYEAIFLRRYVLLLALGELMGQYGFEPCHAAAITAPWSVEQGALIIGASGSGKTTLSLGCASTGCGLLGDDLVLLGEDPVDGTINAYSITQEVSIRAGTIDLWDSLSFLRAFPADLRGKRYCTIEQVRPGATRIQTPVRLLIFSSLTAERESKVVPLSKASTLQELIEQCMGKGNRLPVQEHLFSLLCTLAEQAPGYRIAIARDVSDGPQIIRSLLAGVLYD